MWKSHCTFKYMHCYSRLDQDPISLNRTLSLAQWRGAGGCGESVLNVDEGVFQRAFERLDAANCVMQAQALHASSASEDEPRGSRDICRFRAWLCVGREVSYCFATKTF